MAGRKADWSTLRGTLIGFVLCVLAAGGMLTASHLFKQRMERDYQSNHNRFRNASQQYLAVDEEERIIDEFYPEFVRLYRGGRLGKERRLDWIETLRLAGETIKIPELSYKLEAQRQIEPEYYLPLGGYGIFASNMNLSLGLLHEGDLLRLLQTLEREARGQFSVRRCELRQDHDELTLDPGVSNIRGECTLEWLTIDLAGGRELVL
ncbi:MAG: hypothetical protein ACU85V_12555 [Gammaproteobacteria bacterium]